MSTVPQRKKHQLRVSSYDKVSSWIVSLLIITCVTVGALFMIYITQQVHRRRFRGACHAHQHGRRRHRRHWRHRRATAKLDAPGAEDATAFDEPQMQDTLSALASAVSNRTAILADEQIDFGAQPTARPRRQPHARIRRRPRRRRGRRHWLRLRPRSTAARPNRAAKSASSPPLRTNTPSGSTFSKSSSACWCQDNKVYYAYNLSHEKPDVRVGDPAKEHRLYMNPTDSQFAALDRQLAAKAGIADKGRIILQFYPPEAQAILVSLEQKHAGTRKPETIRSTVFRVTHTGKPFRVQRRRSNLSVFAPTR